MRAGIVAVLIALAVCVGCGAGEYDLFGGPSHSIRIEPLMPMVRPGSSMQLRIIQVARDGTETAANPRDYNLSSSNPAVGIVDRDGLFSGLSPGQTEIACIERGDNRVQAYVIATVDWSSP